MTNSRRAIVLIYLATLVVTLLSAPLCRAVLFSEQEFDSPQTSATAFGFNGDPGGDAFLLNGTNAVGTPQPGLTYANGGITLVTSGSARGLTTSPQASISPAPLSNNAEYFI